MKVTSGELSAGYQGVAGLCQVDGDRDCHASKGSSGSKLQRREAVWPLVTEALGLRVGVGGTQRQQKTSLGVWEEQMPKGPVLGAWCLNFTLKMLLLGQSGPGPD